MQAPTQSEYTKPIRNTSKQGMAPSAIIIKLRLNVEIWLLSSPHKRYPLPLGPNLDLRSKIPTKQATTVFWLVVQKSPQRESVHS